MERQIYHLFKPTGWRPQNFDENILSIKSPMLYNFEKYGTQSSLKLTYWSVAQVLITLVLLVFI
jgi:hypothetical protein